MRGDMLRPVRLLSPVVLAALALLGMPPADPLQGWLWPWTGYGFVTELLSRWSATQPLEPDSVSYAMTVL